MPDHERMKCPKCNHSLFDRTPTGYQCRACATTYELLIGQASLPTQLERARRMVLDITLPHQHTVLGLERVVADSRDQGNGGDGSITVEKWHELWDLQRTAQQLREKVLRWING